MRKRANKNGHTVLLDSGAFSAFRQNRRIDVLTYIDFIHANGHLFNEYANLDVIPGKGSGHDAGEHAAKASWANLELMRRVGLDPMPVYHAGERRYWLERMVGEGHTRIGLGGVAMWKDKDRRLWLDDVFSWLHHNAPDTSTHLFGVTSLALLFRYPATTADSTTWNIQPGFHTIPIPINGLGEPPVLLSVGRSKGRCHISDCGKPERIKIKDFLARVGFTLEEATESLSVRRTISIRYFQGISQHRTNRSHPVHGLFSKPYTLKVEQVPRIFLGISCVRDLKALEGQTWHDYLASFDYLIRFKSMREYVFDRLAKVKP